MVEFLGDEISSHESNLLTDESHLIASDASITSDASYESNALANNKKGNDYFDNEIDEI